METKQFIPWKRFWCQFGEAIHVGEREQGFLTDPEGPYLKFHNDHLLTTDQLLQLPCVVMCGDPGIGKSTELEKAKPLLLQSLHPEDSLIWVDFRDVPSEQVFARRTFESQLWRKWRESGTTLKLVVDGVDEGLIKIPDFVAYLKAQFSSEPVERLQLILVCRSAEWPITTGDSLMRLWPCGKHLPLFELCPLRQQDAGAAAANYGVVSENFLSAVWENGVAGLAAIPVTLFFLLQEFRASGTFSGSHRDLYERGCRRMAREHDKGRLESLRSLRKTIKVITPDEIYFTATRIAGLLLVSGKSSVSTDSQVEDVGSNDLLVTDIIDPFPSTNPLITEDSVFDTLSSGLFTSRGANRFGFAHQTFAECLACEFLMPLPLVQLRSLVCAKDGGFEHVVPQLTETASWVAGRREDFFDLLLELEPAVLLRSDVSKVQGKRKEKLVEALLHLSAGGDLFEETQNRRFYSSLNHPRLGTQLRPYILGREFNTVVRRLALQIAAECKSSDLTDDLLSLVHDASQDQQIRERAIYTLEHLIPEDRLKELIPLARSEIGSDPNETIKGCALRSLVPRVWSVGQVIPLVRAPRRKNISSSYHSVLHTHLPRYLTAADLPLVLGRMFQWTHCFDIVSPFRELAEKAFADALKNLENHRLKRIAVRLWVRKARKHYPLPHNKDSSVVQLFAQEPGIRRSFVAAILNDQETTIDDAGHFQGFHTNILFADDLAWALSSIEIAPHARRSVWAYAISILAQPNTAWTCWDTLLKQIGAITELKNNFLWLRAWELEEPLARNSKARWLRQERWKEKFKREREDIDVEQLIEEHLNAIEAGSTSNWIKLCACLSIDSGENRYHLPLKPELAEYPGWKLSDERRRNRIMNAAREFLLQNDDGYSEIGARTNFSDAGYIAVLLLRPSIEVDSRLSHAIAKNWINALIGQFHNAEDHYQDLTALAFELNPAATVQAFVAEIKEDDSRHGHVLCLHGFRKAWNETFSKTALFLARCGQLKPQSVESILNFVAPLAPELSASTAMELLLAESSNTEPQKELRTVVLTSCLGKMPRQTWNFVWEHLESDSSLKEAVLLRVADRSDYDRNILLPMLSEQQLADLYLRIREVFPPETDPAFQGGFVPPRQSVVHFRNDLINALESRATDAACHQLLRLASELPSESLWLRWRHSSAQLSKRRKEWHPAAPMMIMELHRNAHARSLRDHADFVAVVLESLERLSTKLTRSTLPRAQDLWRWDGAENARRNFTPKDEAFLSDYLASWLRDDLTERGIIVGREVQPRLGQRTDIYLSAIPKVGPSAETLTVVIEVKGCWHPEVRSSLETQLVNDYLRPNGLRHGIYLVGWFVSKGKASSKNYLSSNTYEEARTEVAGMAGKFDGRTMPESVTGLLLDCRYPS